MIIYKDKPVEFDIDLNDNGNSNVIMNGEDISGHISDITVKAGVNENTTVNVTFVNCTVKNN